MATKIIAPNIWGWIADHTGQRMSIVRLASLLSAVTFAGVFLASGYWWLALIMSLFSFFWNAALPQFEAITLNHLGTDSHRYSVIRLWGSIGFIIAVAGLGMFFEKAGTGRLPEILLLLFVGIWVSSLAVPDDRSVLPEHHQGSLRKVLSQPTVVSLFLVCFLIQASHGPYYTFYSLYLDAHDYSETLIGQLWALGVIAEIGVFLKMHDWLPRFGARHLLLWATAATAVRWLLIALFVEQVWIIVFAQTLHAASFGIYHAVAIHLIHQLFTGRHQGRGQALYSSMSFGAGGAVGSLVAGYLWDGVGAQWMYLCAAATAVLAGLIAWRGMQRDR